MSDQSIKGHLHPLTQTIRQAYHIFSNMGYDIALGPELETEFYNFDALNVPADHPARDMQDTFWIKNPESEVESEAKNAERFLLRTQTSAMQIRYLEMNKPPIRVIVPGKVFRNEATDSTHEAQFHQLEGLLVDTKTSLGELKGTLLHFFKEMFGQNVEIRFRPSYFPFVEPGVEVDVQFRGKWLEVMGAGIVHPNVLKAAGVDASKWTGFAFGGGVDRLAMIKYGIDDIRLLYANDARFVQQF